MLIGLFVIFSGSTQNISTRASELTGENWQKIKKFWDIEIQPLVDYYWQGSREKLEQERPKVEQEFNKELGELKDETFMLGKSILGKLKNYIIKKDEE